MKQSKEKSEVLTPESQEDLDNQLMTEMRTMRKQLKRLSKNQLISIVFEQMGLNMEQRQANEVLLEKLGESSEDNS